MPRSVLQAASALCCHLKRQSLTSAPPASAALSSQSISLDRSKGGLEQTSRSPSPSPTWSQDFASQQDFTVHYRLARWVCEQRGHTRPSSFSGGGSVRSHEGATCDLLGKIYHNGESFQPTCNLQCTCMDGAIGCIPLCSDDLRLPSPDCPNPRRVKPPTQCCEEWICQGGSQEPALAGEQSDTGRRGEGISFIGPTSVGERDELLSHTELVFYRENPAARPELNDLQENCLVQTTEWSACSKSCGMGISARVTNDNPQCRLEKESRLCMVRPCDFLREKSIKKGKKCVRTPKSRRAIRFEFSGCISARSYRPKFCGSCTDGRCCTPHTTSTAEVEFRCPEGDVFQRKLMFIKTCSCHHDCPRDNDIFLATYRRRLTGDHVKIERQ
uniref:CCN family member 3 n=1 Tax=Chelydra serpentina TaxID=8475 RepID=A0A8C3SDI2_CHESE